MFSDSEQFEGHITEGQEREWLNTPSREQTAWGRAPVLHCCSLVSDCVVSPSAKSTALGLTHIWAHTFCALTSHLLLLTFPLS